MQTMKNIPIKGFIETSFVDWEGKISSVIVFPRCNFRCRYCHNSELVLRSENIENIDFEKIMQRLSSLKGWVDGVCVSGGEPTLQPSLKEVVKAVKREGFLVKLDTNGSNPKVLQGLIDEGLVDYVAMDVKSQLDESSYCKVTQSPNMLGEVKKSIRILLEGEIKYEFRTTVVPTIHQREDILKLAMELNGADRLRIQNFRPSDTIIDPALKKIKPFPDAEICFLQQRVNDIIGEHPVTD